MDVATKTDTLWSKVATLQSTGVGWVDFVRELHAVPLFGVGFGELLRPNKVNTSRQPCCIATASVPVGKDFLAVSGTDLEAIIRKGSKRRNPWRLVGKVHWHSPDGLAFVSCTCERSDAQAVVRDKKASGLSPRADHSNHTRRVTRSGGGKEKDFLRLFGDLAAGQRKGYQKPNPASVTQVLLPSNFPQLYGRGLRSPPKIVPNGAVIFGHCAKFPLRWSRAKDLPPEEGEPDPLSVDDVSSLFNDSGIGTTHQSTSTDNSSPMPVSLYALGGNPGLSGLKDSEMDGSPTSSPDASVAASDGDVADTSVLRGEMSRKHSIQTSLEIGGPARGRKARRLS